MTEISVQVPFVDLNLQHQPIQTEIELAIKKVIQKGDFILGKALKEFESCFASNCGVKYGVGVGSGTDAIALGLQACGVGKGDEVIVPANTFIASLIAISQTGATPVLVDCDLQTALIDLEAAAKVVTAKTKAILAVHLYGQMVSPQKLLDFATTYNLLIFEDAAQAHLASREGYNAGSIGVAAGFSFYPSKNLGAFGDGGILVTRDEAIAKKAIALRNYGAPRKYYHSELGKNSRLDTIQAAVLNVKLPHLPQWNSARNLAASKYDDRLKKLQSVGISPLHNESGKGHIYHLYVVRITEKSCLKRAEIQDKLAIAGIQTGIHYPIPCHLQPAYQHLGYKLGDFPVAEALSEQILSLPLYPDLKEDNIDFVCEQLAIITSDKIPDNNPEIFRVSS